MKCAMVYALLWVVVIYLWVRRTPGVVLSPTHPEHLANHLYWQFNARGWKTEVRKGFPEMRVSVKKGGFTSAHLYIRPVSATDPRIEVTHRPAATAGMVVVCVILFGAVFPLVIMMVAPFLSAGFVRKEVIPFMLQLVDPRRGPAAYMVVGQAAPVAPVPLAPVYVGPPRDAMEAWAREQNVRNAAPPYPGPQPGPPRPPPP